MELKDRMEQEKARMIDEVKRKQWCSYCAKEAIFYCCWNTSYCSPDCQREHWPTHSEYCTQIRQQQQMQQSQRESFWIISDSVGLSFLIFVGVLDRPKEIDLTYFTDRTPICDRFLSSVRIRGQISDQAIGWRGCNCSAERGSEKHICNVRCRKF